MGAVGRTIVKRNGDVIQCHDEPSPAVAPEDVPDVALGRAEALGVLFGIMRHSRNDFVRRAAACSYLEHVARHTPEGSLLTLLRDEEGAIAWMREVLPRLEATVRARRKALPP